MREFMVTLKSGMRYTVRADRVLRDQHYVTFILNTTPPPNAPNGGYEFVDMWGDAVALFDRGQVVFVVARDHLVSEEKGQAVDPHFVADDDPIPF